MSESIQSLFHLRVEVAAPIVIDPVIDDCIDPGSQGRRFIPITGGTVSEGYSGRVLPGGGDWQCLGPDGRMEIRAHYILDIDRHGTLEVRSEGVRHGPPEVLAALARGEQVDPSTYYFRTAMRFRSGAPGLERLNLLLAYSIGRREAECVLLDVFEIL